MFSRDILTNDLIHMANGADKDSLSYTKHEESVYVNKILERSHGTLKLKLDFTHDSNQNESYLPDDNDDENDIDKTTDFGKQFASNGSFMIQKVYCKQRTKRSVIFADLKSPDIEKATLLATIDSG